MTIGESIRHHRKRLGLTQLELAKRVGVSVQAISKWETNTGLPDISMAVPLARAMGTTTDELLQFGQRRKEQERLWMETMQRSRDDPEKMLGVALEALKEFPWDWQFLYRAAVAGMRIADNLQDLHVRHEALGRAAAHAQLAVEMDPENQSSKWIRDEIKKDWKMSPVYLIDRTTMLEGYSRIIYFRFTNTKQKTNPLGLAFCFMRVG